MDFEFSEEEKIFRETVEEFCEKYIAPRWIQIDEEAEREPTKIPLDLVERMGEHGFFAIPCSEEYGGLGGTFTMAAIAVETIAYYDPSIALAVYTLLNNGWPYVLELHGRSEVSQEVIHQVAKGRAFFGIATTEPQGGSDIAGIRTSARYEGGKYYLSGEKSNISGVGEVQALPWGGGWLLLARTAPLETRHRGLTAFAYLAKRGGRKDPSFESTIYRDIGRHAITTGGFKLREAEVGEEFVVGEVNRGFYVVMEGFNLARLLVAAAALGTWKWALDKAVEWFRQRKLFDRYISSFQGVSFKFAELYARYEATRLMVYKTAWLADRIYKQRDPSLSPRDLNVPAAIAKMMAPEGAVDTYEEVMKWHGAYAYTKECPIHRGWLGVFSYVIGAEGAQNIMRYIIARDVIGSEYVRA